MIKIKSCKVHFNANLIIATDDQQIVPSPMTVRNQHLLAIQTVSIYPSVRTTRRLHMSGHVPHSWWIGPAMLKIIQIGCIPLLRVHTHTPEVRWLRQFLTRRTRCALAISLSQCIRTSTMRTMLANGGAALCADQ